MQQNRHLYVVTFRPTLLEYRFTPLAVPYIIVQQGTTAKTYFIAGIGFRQCQATIQSQQYELGSFIQSQTNGCRSSQLTYSSRRLEYFFHETNI